MIKLIISIYSKVRKLPLDASDCFYHTPASHRNDHPYHLTTYNSASQLGWQQQITLSQGLQNTIRWYLSPLGLQWLGHNL